MAIIVEGFDNSGKSTLAESFGLEVIHPGLAPKGRYEESKCLEVQAKQARLPVVLDRVTCISTQVYGGRLFDPYLKSYLTDMLTTHHCVLIYCRPDLDRILDFSRHQSKGYDKPSQVDWLKKNAVRLVAQYDQLMSGIPHIKYDWADPDMSKVQLAYDAQFTIGAWRKCLTKA